MGDEREFHEKSVEELWVEEMRDRGMTIDELIAELGAELINTTDEEDAIWLNTEINRLWNMKHS